MEELMKKSFLIGPAGILIALLFLGSCFSLPGGDSGLFGGVQQSLSDRASAEIASATGLTGMTNKMMFNMMYSQVLFIGGFGAGFYELEETQGAIWSITSTAEDGTVSKVDAERALLKKLPNGDEWWYLSWRTGTDSMEYEALLNKDYQAKKIRYYNPDVKRIEEAVFTETAAPKSDEAPPPEPGASSLDMNDLSSLSKGNETIKIGSSTYNTERLEWVYTDQEENATYDYTWWVDTKTAGGLVKYNWTKSGSKESLSGELSSLKKGYTTKFNSF